MKKVWKYLLALGVVLLSVGSGIFIQRVFLNEEVASLEPKKVAIVNMDEGILKNGETINYAVQILGNNDDWEITSIQNAKEGLLNGSYGAYVIIPTDFSKCVESLNTTPKQAALQVEIANELSEQANRDTYEKLSDIQSRLNYQAGYMYLSSILGEFHAGQDASVGVLANDTSILSDVGSINPNDLTVYFEVPDAPEEGTHNLVLDIEPEKEAVVDQTTIMNNSIATTEESMVVKYADIEAAYAGIKLADTQIKASYNSAKDTYLGDDKLGTLSDKIATNYQSSLNSVDTSITAQRTGILNAINETEAQSSETQKTAITTQVNTFIQEINIPNIAKDAYARGVQDAQNNGLVSTQTTYVSQNYSFVNGESGQLSDMSQFEALVNAYKATDDPTELLTYLQTHQVQYNEQTSVESQMDTPTTYANSLILSDEDAQAYDVTELEKNTFIQQLVVGTKTDFSAIRTLTQNLAVAVGSVDSEEAFGTKSKEEISTFLNEFHTIVNGIAPIDFAEYDLARDGFDIPEEMQPTVQVIDNSTQRILGEMKSVDSKASTFEQALESFYSEESREIHTYASTLTSDTQAYTLQQQQRIQDGIEKVKGDVGERVHENANELQAFTNKLSYTRNGDAQSQEVKKHILQSSYSVIQGGEVVENNKFAYLLWILLGLGIVSLLGSIIVKYKTKEQEVSE